MANSNTNLLQPLLPYARPSTLPTVRRSQLLADALERMNQTGAEQSKTPLALAANLAADYLLNSAGQDNMSKLQQQLTGDQQSFVKGLVAGIPGMEDIGADPAPAMGAAPAPKPAAAQIKVPGSAYSDADAMADALKGVNGGPKETVSEQMASVATPAPAGAPPAQDMLPARLPGAVTRNALPPANAGTPAPLTQTPGAVQPIPAASAPAGPPAASAAPQSPAGPMGKIPTQTVMPEEIARARQLLTSGDPRLVDKGIELAMDIEKRYRTPVTLSPGFTYNPDGTTRDLQHTTRYLPGPKPGTFIMTDETGKSQVLDLGTTGTTPEGMTINADGSYSYPGVRLADGSFSPIGKPTPGEVQKIIEDFQATGKPYSIYKSIHNKLEGVLSTLKTNPGAIADSALIDLFMESVNGNPNLAVSEGFFKKTQEAQGFIASLVNAVKNGFDPGSILVPPNVRDDIIAVAKNAEDERYKSAVDQAIMLSNTAKLTGISKNLIPDVLPSSLEKERRKAGKGSYAGSVREIQSGENPTFPETRPPLTVTPPPAIEADQGRSTGATPPASAPPGSFAPDALPRPTSKAERDALPRGAWYLAPDGSRRQRK